MIFLVKLKIFIECKMKYRKLFLIIFLCSSNLLSAQENCSNGKDDDGDGRIDLNDTADCICKAPVSNFNFIPNPSFEKYSRCPEENDFKDYNFAELNLADSWYRPTFPTPDYFNTCGYFPFNIPTPLPDGNGCVGLVVSDMSSNREEIATCLLKPMLAGVKYTLEFTIVAKVINDVSGELESSGALDPIRLTLYGNSNCVPDPIEGDCLESTGFKEIGSVTYVPSNNWSTIKMSFTPSENVESIILGPPCELPASYHQPMGPWNFPYFLLDNLILNDTSVSIPKNVINQTGSLCNNNLQLEVKTDRVDGFFQWYKSGVALINETQARLDVSGKNYGIGTYSCRLTFASPNMFCSISSAFVSEEKIVANFTSSANEICAYQPVLFTNTTNAIGNFLWDFGDGQISNEVNPLHYFVLPGTYDIKLSVNTAGGCVSEIIKNMFVKVLAAPNANFDFTKEKSCTEVKLNLTNQSTIAAKYYWDFGDGTLDQSTNPTHVYTKVGNYDVKLHVLSINGCSDDTVAVGIIQSNDFKILSFNSNATKTCTLPFQVNFYNNSNTTGICTWDFGDGTISSDPFHLYKVKGIYSVKLTMLDDDGCLLQTTNSKMISIFEPPKMTFSVDHADDCYPHTVNFTSTSNLISNCLWDFGDNSTSSECNPKHTYISPGIFDVKLSLTSNDMCVSDSTVKGMVVVYSQPKPVADFSFDPQNANIFQSKITFTDLSTSTITSWAWHFNVHGSTEISEEKNPVKIFPSDEEGLYPVLLKVVNAVGCIDSITKNVFIADFSSLFIPNSFTPNNDGINDRWVISHNDLSYFKLTVFNRWGEVVFTTNDPDEAWDGTFKGARVEMDVYVYKIYWEGDKDGKKIVDTKIGKVTLIR